MKFSNVKGETVNVDLSTNDKFNAPVWAKSGGGRCCF
jgi:hypothetical protein